MNKIERINEVGDRVFLNPQPLLSYEILVQKSLGPKTYRGFHKEEKEKEGAAEVFRSFLTKDKGYIVETIRKSNSQESIDELSNYICKKLKVKLINNKKNQLKSFNKLRKPVDIFIEHIVAMCDSFDESTRQRVTEWLYLPLDSQMFQSDFVFSDLEIDILKIKRKFTFKDIESEDRYHNIQSFLIKKGKKIGVKHRIYFDLEWNNRYQSSGTNLFATNPEKKQSSQRC